MFKKDQDVRLGVLVILLSGIFLTQVEKLPAASAMFPRALLYLMIFSGVCIIIKAFFTMKRRGKPYEKMTVKQFLFESGIPGGILLILCSLLEVLGFYIVSFVVIIAVCILQEYIVEGTYHFSGKYIGNTLIFAAGSTVFMFICFSVLLSLPTPRGVFGF